MVAEAYTTKDSPLRIILGAFPLLKKLQINVVFHYDSPTIFSLCFYDIKPFKSQNFSRRIKINFYCFRLFTFVKF